MNEKDLKALVEQLVGQMVGELDTNVVSETVKKVTEVVIDNDACIDDITEVDIRKQLLVKNPKDAEAYLDIKSKTPARIGIGRAGTRYKTETVLRFRADHAAAQDAVFSYVDEEFIKENNMFAVETLCSDKDEYLTRPDLGRKFSPETINNIKSKLGTNQRVLMLVGDGLSSAAIEANLKDCVPAIKQGLKMYGIDSSEILFVKHCRVGAMDHLGEELGCEVICMLVGERPGLVTAESMSAYIAYKPYIGMAEAKRTVISNIHKGGTTAVEAGAHIAELIKTMLDKKASGIDLK
ncbi:MULTISPECIES: ethanolamine ammonia-lyase subunit EutC [unclassified Clostridioides]|uniref:ethanolamine ammonia-lyase subunit EutC n=1 Tax=unclassified Clostridioides TaxID=2635829 RepID=UPI001D10F817|nr:ethanolamine ammonia-lyase subunit EutC [Clostridioides sp. ZZV14-6150]MCC0658940.1 ethanolamine ammonia-lyase subunit EutC [Clostridioides sp. ZZV14-6154]MCC0667791.1 ethanolamine ammonia-lyase subunit EutC [Clostridioides sp. ZZV14-6153]MCC0724564.1 ethanolamine ammonia-lyase subunit EutC [Clostridioides sp. ZZV14-6104]MCC0727605.1 ethanolamine ammonia-lyase subunit EutC [Clostridioides sp. ZZV14-6045]MCC0730209.1 ethanolamine ammonia-lyase subunit EutC [Clostridioides sp. ZZV14-6048]MCC